MPIWNALKRDGICKVSAVPAKHKVIIKNVRNARDDDLGYRLQLAEMHKTHTITVEKNGAVITFRLITKLLPTGL